LKIFCLISIHFPERLLINSQEKTAQNSYNPLNPRLGI